MQVLEFVRTMAERGVAVLFISHNMQHVFQATDRIVVLRHGQKVGDVADGGGDRAADRHADHRLRADRRRTRLRRLMRAAADVGGTFTDILLQLPSGEIAYRKVLSSPPAYDVAVVDGVAELLGEVRTALEEVVHGTTVATNAVLERRGARTALVTTKGFRDVLELRRVRMPHLYDLFWSKPPPLVERSLRLELDERMSAAGEVLRPLDDDEVRAVAARLRELGVESVAVCLLHAHRHPGARAARGGDPARGAARPAGLALERDPARAAGVRAQRDDGRERVRAAADGALHRRRSAPASTRAGIGAPLTIMQSSGGVMTAGRRGPRPVFALESGPAAGVVAALSLARGLGIENAIAFDMGGTTAKASLVEAGRVSRSREYEVGASLSAGSRLLRGSGELIRIPTIDIAEVGAGGG